MDIFNRDKPQAHELIQRLMASDRMRSSSHFSERVYTSEPILTTGRQMASYLPDKYRSMRAISRWEAGTNGQAGRWPSEAELFYRQGIFMADWEDDCPYQGTFKSYFPTYSAMSDRQLRGYFTWRAAVRRGAVEEASLSFAYVYLYELINGIGVNEPIDGFRKLEDFWQTYRAFAPEIDRFASVWLQDYVVYHGLSPELLEPYKTLAFDRSLIALRHAEEAACPAERMLNKRKRGESALPLPPDAALEDELLGAIDALSTYHVINSRLYKEQPNALRHVACAVFVRMSEYHRKQRKSSFIESMFGEEVALAYTMFGSAVFYEAAPHADAIYELDGVHRYRCERGHWTCERFHGSRSKSPRLGDMVRAVDRRLREALGFQHPLKETGKTPKYLQKFIDDEIAIWLAWNAAHAPRRIEINLAQLAGIRAAAETTRESLLIDEEREEASEPGAHLQQKYPQMGNLAFESEAHDVPLRAKSQVTNDRSSDGNEIGPSGYPFEGTFAQSVPQNHEGSMPRSQGDAGLAATERSGHPSDDEKPVSVGVEALFFTAPTAPPLSPEQVAYLNVLLDGGSADATTLSVSEDLLVDAINEALFGLIGDTVIEYGENGPEIIEDYRDDVEGLISHV